MMITCSAPGKIYFFGEHAVVYGKSAITCAIELRTYVTVKKSENTVISSPLGKTGLNYDVHPYVSTALKILGCENVSINIKSDIPISAGLGSSAAVTVATVSAINLEFSLGYDKTDIAKISHEVEKKVQGIASETDTYTSTFGKIIEIVSKESFEPLECSIVIGNTNKPFKKSLEGKTGQTFRESLEGKTGQTFRESLEGKTGQTFRESNNENREKQHFINKIKETNESSKTARIVKQVAELKNEYPCIINQIIDTIGILSEMGKTMILKKDYYSLGKLMNVNHGLLDAIGVGTSELNSLVYAAREAGAFGAKITGAGGGGCMFALTNSPEKVAKAIQNAGGEAIITSFAKKGVMNI